MSEFFSAGGKAAESSGGGQRFFLGFLVSSFPAGWEALRPNCSVAHWDNKLAQSGSDRPSSMALCNKLWGSLSDLQQRSCQCTIPLDLTNSCLFQYADTPKAGEMTFLK